MVEVEALLEFDVFEALFWFRQLIFWPSRNFVDNKVILCRYWVWEFDSNLFLIYVMPHLLNHLCIWTCIIIHSMKNCQAKWENGLCGTAQFSFKMAGVNIWEFDSIVRMEFSNQIPVLETCLWMEKPNKVLISLWIKCLIHVFFFKIIEL